jgi:plasmid stabilization system protein ParE
MNSPLPVRIVSSAARAIAEAAQWWRTNRPNTPDAFITDLENSLKLIASHPGIGARARNAKLEGVRRVHLARVRYHLYYRVTQEHVIEVLALWHTSRENDPELQ